MVQKYDLSEIREFEEI
jgi:hypothetical protein